jgi:hypothetical protein
MIAALIVLAVFIGLGFCILMAAGAMLVAAGKLTIPGTNMRKLQQARVSLEIAKMDVERESLNMRVDEAIHRRLERVTDPTSWGDVKSEVVPYKEGES